MSALCNLIKLTAGEVLSEAVQIGAYGLFQAPIEGIADDGVAY